MYVRFFSGGRVRLVLSSRTSNSEEHPIQRGDIRAKDFSISGHRIGAVFSEKNLTDLQFEIDRDRKMYGDLR